jgi:molybdopterin-containing oxidoreductase family iron-sulfur binding subunit
MELQRRDFLKIIGSATVATALPACTPKKPTSLIPYVIPHEEIVPGKAVWYASTCRECPAGCGIHVRVREGRAVKVEGNPVHPINQGTLCSRGQASLQGMYDPDRIQTPLLRQPDGRYAPIPWDEAERLVQQKIDELIAAGKQSEIGWITPHMTGSLNTAIDEFLRAVGSRRRLRYEPIAFEGIRKAHEVTYGRSIIPTYHFDRAKYVLSFGADYLETWLSPVSFSKEYTESRSFDGVNIARSVYVGPRLSMTATNADEWLRVAPGMEAACALGILHIVLESRASGSSRDLRSTVKSFTPEKVSSITGIPAEKLRSIAQELIAATPSLIVAGSPVVAGPSEVPLLVAVNLLNEVLGNRGTTVDVGSPHALSSVDTYADLLRFTQAMEKDEISLLFMTDTNPVYASPPSANVTHALKKVPFSIALSSFMDETTQNASLVLPVLTPLESWGDYEPAPDTRGLMQPVMQPVFKGARMTGDVVLRLTDYVRKRTVFSNDEQPFLSYVRSQWRAIHRASRTGVSFDQWWMESLANGGTFDRSSRRVRQPRRRVSAGTLKQIFEQAAVQPETDGLTLVTYPSINHYDGRGANKPWLQEVPDPMTQLTWENWVEIHPDDAKIFDIKKGDLVELRTQFGTLEIRAYPYAGIRPGTIAVPIGQGHTAYGRYAEDQGANIISLLPPLPVDSSDSLQWSGIPVDISNKGQQKRLADVAGSDYLHGRNLVQVVTIDELLKQTKDFAEGRPIPGSEGFGKEDGPSLYPDHEHPDHRWGMAIDLEKCTGCSACVTACYAENNIPVVGKEQVEIGRELSWLRVERYFDEPQDPAATSVEPKAEFMPMMCQQCDNAPCEPVCPVYAAYHTPEGLNAQVYNRCVGTRYCANNCPYKVRRFNWFDYEFPEPLNWQLNPDVTVRSKGVMEKCTFCVQRIIEGRDQAKKEGRPVKDGDIKTACQQSCPSQAIEFGDLKDSESRVSALRTKEVVRGYRALEELSTQPAVVYLKEIRS